MVIDKYLHLRLKGRVPGKAKHAVRVNLERLVEALISKVSPRILRKSLGQQCIFSSWRNKNPVGELFGGSHRVGYKKEVAMFCPRCAFAETSSPYITRTRAVFVFLVLGEAEVLWRLMFCVLTDSVCVCVSEIISMSRQVILRFCLHQTSSLT